MKRLDAGIGIIAIVLVAGVFVGTLLFRGNIDEWGANIVTLGEDTRVLAESFREAVTEDMRENPDGFYKLDMEAEAAVRYYLFWRVRPKDEGLPGYLRERLGELAADPEVDAVGEAASATVHLFSWRNRDRQRLGRWFKRRGIEGVEVEVFAHRTSERRSWRRVGTLDESGTGKALGESDVDALRKSRFNRIVVIASKEAH